MTTSYFNKVAGDNNFKNAPKNSTIQLDALFGKDLIVLPELQTLLNYWQKKKGKRIFPARSDLNPTDIISILPNIFILDLKVVDGKLEDVIVSLMGTAVANLYGEISGKSASELPDLEVVNRTLFMCQECLQLREPIANKVNVLTEDRPHISVSSLYCPLSSNGQDIDKIIGYVAIM